MIKTCLFGQNEKFFYANKTNENWTIKKSVTNIDSRNSYKTFEIELLEDGNYYLGAWLMGNYKGKNFDSISLKINNGDIISKICPSKATWQSILVSDKNNVAQKFALKKGINTFTFISAIPEIPQIEFIKISKDLEKSIIPEKNYLDFLNQIKSKKIHSQPDYILNESDTNSYNLKSVLPNPPDASYWHYISAPCKYTWFVEKSYLQNNSITITSVSENNYQYVLEVFNETSPHLYSWVKKSNSSGQISLAITFPVSGIYLIRLRAYQQTTQGIVDIQGVGGLFTGSFSYQDCPVTGTGIAHPHETPHEYNYFTAKYSNCDPMVFIERSNEAPGKIIGYNDDYFNATGDFQWLWNARVKKDFSDAIQSMLISSASSFNPSGTCDIYMRCTNSSLPGPNYPNLKADDAITAAPENNTYNCASWAGGITDGWYWGCKFANASGGSCIGLNYGNPYMWNSWDNYFANYPSPRYANAMSYTTIGATSSNADIALWSTDGTIEQLQHVSVRNYSNNNPHGYDWESKPGGKMRTFHPRDALNGPEYGEIFAYYTRIVPSKSSVDETMTFDQSVASGLTIIENVELTNPEKILLKSKIDSKRVGQLENFFDKWKQSLYSAKYAYNSNPYVFLTSDEYSELNNYLLENEIEGIAFLAEKLFGDELNRFEKEITSLLLCELAAKNHLKDLENVKKDQVLKSYTQEGAYNAPTAENITKKFMKRIFFDTQEIIEEDSYTILKNKYNSHEYFNIYPNPISDISFINLKLEEENFISLTIYNSNGNTVTTLINNQLYNSGIYNFELSDEGLTSGIYVCSIKIGDQIFNRKFIVQ